MKQQFHNLPHHLLGPGTLISQDHKARLEKPDLNDPALTLMTDFKHIRPFTINATANIDEINSRMIACGVRLLFVAENSDTLIGLVTYNDIYGEKPVRYLQQHGGKREEILAQEIMTPLHQLEALQLSAVLKSRVGDIVATLKACGRQHLLVIDNEGQQPAWISGLFSSTRIEKMLGIKIDLSARVHSFAELERALNE